ncbi:MAG: 3-phosphoshikimate 1-carboxyvinyltransferase, partial [Firmicutes bacterium]|nr:3-phosphoshikimate 1-carboxyvinyltransferase [Bacillota bacterium]
MNVLIRPGKLLGTIDAMPSKSHAHRVLIAQKLAQLQGQRKEDALAIPTFSDDIDATKNCLV